MCNIGVMNTMATTTTAPRQLTTKDTAAELRKTLRATFPRTKFSARMSTGTGYGWINVTWTDGPTTKQVRALTDRFQSERFSGMDDSYHATRNTVTLVTGETVTPNSCGINGSRHISPEARDWAARTTGVAATDTLGPDTRVTGHGHSIHTGDYPRLGGDTIHHMWLAGLDLTDVDLTA